MNTNVLNKLQQIIIDSANAKGISLQAEFGSVEKFKQFVISLAIKSLVDAGVELKDAFDFILGAGEYDALAERVWLVNQPSEAAVTAQS